MIRVLCVILQDSRVNPGRSKPEARRVISTEWGSDTGRLHHRFRELPRSRRGSLLPHRIPPVARLAFPRPTAAAGRHGVRVLRREGPLRLRLPPLRLPGVRDLPSPPFSFLRLCPLSFFLLSAVDSRLVSSDLLPCWWYLGERVGMVRPGLWISWWIVRFVGSRVVKRLDLASRFVVVHENNSAQNCVRACSDLTLGRSIASLIYVFMFEISLDVRSRSLIWG